MGGGFSRQLDQRQRRYLQGRTEAVVKNFIPYYHRQYGAAFLRHLWKEMEQQEKHSHQLMTRHKESNSAEGTIVEDNLMLSEEDPRRWKERYCRVRGDFTVEWFFNKQASEKGSKPMAQMCLTGYLLTTSEKEYREMVNKFCLDTKGGNSSSSDDPFETFPTQYHLFLFHPFQKHFCACLATQDSQQTWYTVLYDGIRHHSMDVQRRGTFASEAFLEAVRFYLQEKGIYGTGELLLGTESEVLSNVVMEDMMPALCVQIPRTLRGTESKKKATWLNFLQEVYAVVLQDVSRLLQATDAEKEEWRHHLEKTVRPDMDQIFTLREQLIKKLKVTLTGPVESCYTEDVEPYLCSVVEELISPLSTAFQEVRLLFSESVSDIIRNVQNNWRATLLDELLAWFTDLPEDSVRMHQCYEKVECLQQSLENLKDRFGFKGTRVLILRAQNLMQQIMANTVYTFQQLLQQQLNKTRNSDLVSQTLENVRGRALKKFDYDSSLIRKQFVQEAVIQIILPYLLKTLEPHCKLILPEYERYVFADYNSVLYIEAIYEDILIQTLLQTVTTVLKEASSQKKHNLYSESLMCIYDREENMLDQNAADNMPTSNCSSYGAIKQKKNVHHQDKHFTQQKLKTITEENSNRPYSETDHITKGYMWSKSTDTDSHHVDDENSDLDETPQHLVYGNLWRLQLPGICNNSDEDQDDPNTLYENDKGDLQDVLLEFKDEGLPLNGRLSALRQ
ncbi:protein Niban 3 [Protopterus annectens]|uniref:protein Niban 3 n=1 Tax=Protopterus annectens TaxID=7888 RepID=UPI001CFB9CBD|nr:protein Niban 3 [Protopterus annectens]